jgi:hypothetical protein
MMQLPYGKEEKEPQNMGKLHSTFQQRNKEKAHSKKLD